jgi:hypothetical protein
VVSVVESDGRGGVGHGSSGGHGKSGGHGSGGRELWPVACGRYSRKRIKGVHAILFGVI